MKYNNMETKVSIPLMGEDFIASVEFELASEGFAGSWDDPPYDPEIDIQNISLQREVFDGDKWILGPSWDVSGQQFSHLCWNDKIIQACIEEYIDNRNSYNDY